MPTDPRVLAKFRAQEGARLLLGVRVELACAACRAPFQGTAHFAATNSDLTVTDPGTLGHFVLDPADGMCPHCSARV